MYEFKNGIDLKFNDSSCSTKINSFNGKKLSAYVGTTCPVRNTEGAAATSPTKN